MAGDLASRGSPVEAFDFVALAEEIRLHWVTLCYSLEPLVPLNQALHNLAKALPAYLDDALDPKLEGALRDLAQAQDALLAGLQIAEKANRGINECFLQMRDGLQALRQIHEVGNKVGFGTA